MKTNQNISKGHHLLVMAVAIAGLAPLHAQAAPYPDMPVSGPANIDLSWMDPFDPPVNPALPVPAGAPEIAEWTRSNEPGDTMALTGEMLSSFTGIAEGRDTRFVVYGEGWPETDALIQRLDGRQCAITLPTNLPSDEMYLIWPSNDKGYGEPVPVNQTEAWWVGLDRVATGETFSVYGQNLSLGGDECYLYIEGYGWVTSTEANPYKADFIVPDSLTNGSYTIWAHNGKGREYGWSDPLEITVQDKIVWDDDSNTWFNVKSYGAVGDGVTDDTDEILDAISAAQSAEYSTIYFPAGTYLVSAQLGYNVGNVRYKGAGMDSTIVLATSDSFTSSYSAIFVIANNCAVEDLEVNKGDLGLTCVRTQGGGVARQNIRLNRVKLSALSRGPDENTQNGSVLYFSSADNFVAKDCVFIINWGITGTGGTHITFDNCEFVGIGDSNGLMAYSGSTLSVVNCYAHPYNANDTTSSLGWCKGRWIYGGGTISKVYIGDNVSSNMAPRYAEPFYSGNPTAVDPAVKVDPNNTSVNAPATQRLVFDDLNRETIGNVQATYDAVRPEWGMVIDRWDYAAGEVVLRGQYQHMAAEGDTNVNVLFFEIVDQNSGEQFLWEGMNTYYAGTPTAVANSTNLIFNGLTADYSGWTLIIAEGRGAGQSSKLSDFDTSRGEVHLASPLRVLPDSTSLCKIGKFLDRVVVYNNNLNGTDRASQAGVYTATTGFSCYGGASRLVIDGNRLTKMKSGIVLWSGADKAPNNIMQPNVFNVVKNNTIDSCQIGISHVINDWGYGVRRDKTFYCNITRSNRIVNSTITAFGNSTSDGRQRKDLCVFQGNFLTNNAMIITEDDGGIYNQLWIGNNFTVSGTGHTNISVVSVDDDSSSYSISYPLNAFNGNSLRAEVYDRDTGESRMLEKLEDMDSMIIKDLTIGHEYRVRLYEHNGSEWIYVGGSERSFRF